MLLRQTSGSAAGKQVAVHRKCCPAAGIFWPLINPTAVGATVIAADCAAHNVSGEVVAAEIRRRVQEETHLTCSGAWLGDVLGLAQRVRWRQGPCRLPLSAPPGAMLAAVPPSCSGHRSQPHAGQDLLRQEQAQWCAGRGLGWHFACCSQSAVLWPAALYFVMVS